MKKTLSAFVAAIMLALCLCSCQGRETEKYQYKCSYTVECIKVLDNFENLNGDKKDIIPSDGIIFEDKEVGFNDGDTVYDVLIRVCKENKIQLDSEITPAYNSAYVKGINNLYTGDCGEYSGWLFYVNGESAAVGANTLKLSENDEVLWKFVCDFNDEF